MIPTLMVDLDGTLTKKEILPEIASLIGQEKYIREMTEKTMRGEISFIESFRLRVEILSEISIQEASELVSNIELRENLLVVLKNWPGETIVVTSNLDCWVEKLLSKHELNFVSSKAKINNSNKLIGIDSIIDKAQFVTEHQNITIFIGDGENDSKALKVADYGIAFSKPNQLLAGTLLESSDYAFTDEEDLCKSLQLLL